MIRTKIFGCKTNKFYAEKWLASGELDGLHGIFVVSCVVTDQAKSRWIKYVTKQAQELKNSNEKVYLSGCGSLDGGKLDPKFWEKYPQLQQYQGCIVLLGQEPHTVA